MAFVLLRPKKKELIITEVKPIVVKKAVPVPVPKKAEEKGTPTSGTRALKPPSGQAFGGKGPSPGGSTGQTKHPPAPPAPQQVPVILTAKITGYKAPERVPFKKALTPAMIRVQVTGVNESDRPVTVRIWPEIELCRGQGFNEKCYYPGGVIEFKALHSIAGLRKEGNVYYIDVPPHKPFGTEFELWYSDIPPFHFDKLDMFILGSYKPEGGQYLEKKLLAKKEFDISELTKDFPEYQGGSTFFPVSQQFGPGSDLIQLRVYGLTNKGFYIDAVHYQKGHLMTIHAMLESMKDLSPGESGWGEWKETPINLCGGKWYQYHYYYPKWGVVPGTHKAWGQFGLPAGEEADVYIPFGSPLPDGEYRLIVIAQTDDVVKSINPNGPNKVEPGVSKTVQISFKVENGKVIILGVSNEPYSLATGMLTPPGGGTGKPGKGGGAGGGGTGKNEGKKGGGKGVGKRFTPQPVPIPSPIQVEGYTRERQIEMQTREGRRREMMESILNYEVMQGNLPPGEYNISSQPTSAKTTTGTTSTKETGKKKEKKTETQQVQGKTIGEIAKKKGPEYLML